ncbi:MAG: hypothetical protein KBB70_02810 [Candidatus Pacebacteria bacterium]|nr:hypothetical protein [Candidatus Paceibacterota bacterium]
MKKIFSSFLLSVATFAIVFSLPLLARAEANAGFIDTSIWFSNEPETVGESTTISTLINNQDAKAIYGMIGFYDNGKLITQKATTVDPRASKVVSITWKVTVGSHSMVAKFENTRYTNEKGTATVVSKSETAPYRFTVLTPEAKETADSKATANGTNGTPGSSASKTEVEKTVDDAKDAAEGAFAKFDNFRTKTAETLVGKVAGAQKSIEDIKEIPKKEQTFLQTPFAYLKLLFFKAAHFIFSSMYAFYGLIILIIILFVRYLIRAPR